MSTESEVIKARYSTVEKEADALGRVIGVRRLKPSEQTKVAGMCSDLVGGDEVTSETGDKVTIPHRLPLLIASAVCLINESPIPFPRSRGELDAIFDRLDAEGLAAAGKAMARLSETIAPTTAEDAKN